jgi:hypothetical protein
VLIRTRVQIAAFCLSALAGGTMFWRWWRIGEESRQRVWALYGWFSGLMFCGSLFGAISSAAWMQFTAFYITINHPLSSLTNAEIWRQYALAFRWLIAFFIFSALEFFGLSVAKLMVLHRMVSANARARACANTHTRKRTNTRARALTHTHAQVSFAVPKGDSSALRFSFAGRIVMACAVFGNVVGLCGNIAAAVQWKNASDRAAAASAAYAASSADAGALGKLASDQEQLAAAIGSVQQFSEVAVLLLIIAAFVVVGVVCARRVSSVLRLADGEGEAVGRKLRQQVVVTVAVVFVTFLLRALYSIMFAIANAEQNQGADCNVQKQSACDSTCSNTQLLVLKWLLFTPEFYSMQLLLSSPLSLLVALWGMTTDRMLQLMNAPQQSKAEKNNDAAIAMRTRS